MRIDQRKDNQLRPIQFKTNVNPYAEGSCEISCGKTRVLTTASVEKETPRWMDDDQGWITAEYGMLPRSTHTRMRREASASKQSGRTVEIQRLIGRSLRQSVELTDIPGITINLDCDVICADGGTRTAAISAAWVALAQALSWAKDEGLVKPEVQLKHVSAISLGAQGDRYLLDLCYEEDSNIDFDLNLVFLNGEEIIEVQGTGEKRAIRPAEFSELLTIGQKACNDIISLQKDVLTD